MRGVPKAGEATTTNESETCSVKVRKRAFRLDPVTADKVRNGLIEDPRKGVRAASGSHVPKMRGVSRSKEERPALFNHDGYEIWKDGGV